MSAKTTKLIYFISTGLLTLMMLGSAGMYIVKHGEVSAIFESLGHPSYLVYPLAIAKILGLIAIWTNKSNALKEWAYAGFFFDFILATAAHLSVGDGEHFGALMALVVLLVSYTFGKRMTAA